jgi:outer membrane protein assembly factor BamB
LEETELPEVTERGFFTGTAEHRAGNARTGAFDVEPVRQAQGRYWVHPTPLPIDGAPVAYGNMLLVAGNDGTLYGLDQRTGGVIWRLLAEGPIHTAPAVGTIATADAASPAIVVVAGDDGIVRAREALPDRVTERWDEPLGERIRSSPVVADGVVYAATTDGSVHALDLGTGAELWRFPRRGAVGPITADLTFHDGVLYVATSDATGTVILLDVATGEEICRRETDAAIDVNPIVSDEVVYVANTGSQVYMFPAGVCNGIVAGRPPSLLRERPVIAAPAIRDNVMYIGEGTFLYAIDLDTNSGIWDEVVQAGEQVRSVTVAGDVVYAGSDDGNLYAVDAGTGETLWTWQTDGPVRAATAVIDHVVYAVSLDGSVYAIGED